MSELFTLTPPEEDDVYAQAVGFADDAEYYVLDAKRRPVAATQEQFETMTEDAKMVCDTRVGDHRVTTEFIGYNNSDDEDEQPLVFQTFIETPRGVQHGGCFATWSEATADHRRTVELLRSRSGETKH